jgi:hypothetical protein
MALIVLSENAPQEKIHFSLSSVSFDLAPGESFETDDNVVLADARTHPWLTIKIVEPDPEPEPGDDEPVIELGREAIDVTEDAPAPVVAEPSVSRQDEVQVETEPITPTPIVSARRR